MKLLRYGPVGIEKPGVLDDQGRVRSLAATDRGGMVAECRVMSRDIRRHHGR